MNPLHHDKLDALTEWSLPLELQEWIERFRAPFYESAIAKDIPMTDFNLSMNTWLNRYIKTRRKYRGSSKKGYRRPASFCHADQAERFAVYLR